MTDKSAQTVTSITTPLALLFVGLKLMGYIDWSWLWVLSPLWLPATVFFGLALFAFAIVGVMYLIEKAVNGHD